jgi:drug/metabolite transporter (DMT)-like permease
MELHSISGRSRLGLALALLSSLLWGAFPIFLKLASQGVDIYTITWFRLVGAFALLTVYLLWRKQFPSRQNWGDILWGLVAIACLFLLGNYLLFLIGLRQTSPGNAQLCFQFSTLFFAGGGMLIFREHYTRRQWLGVAVMILGFTLFFHEQLRILIQAQWQYIIASGLIILSSASWAVYALAQKQLLQKLPSPTILLMVYGISGFLLTPLATPRSLVSLSPPVGMALLFCTLNTVLAYGAFGEAMAHLEVSKISAILAVNPIITLVLVTSLSFIFPMIFHPEKLTFLAILGAVLVVSGSMTISLGKSKNG